MCCPVPRRRSNLCPEPQMSLRHGTLAHTHKHTHTPPLPSAPTPGGLPPREMQHFGLREAQTRRTDEVATCEVSLPPYSADVPANWHLATFVPGHFYRARVCARNGYGYSKWSAWSTPLCVAEAAVPQIIAVRRCDAAMPRRRTLLFVPVRCHLAAPFPVLAHRTHASLLRRSCAARAPAGPRSGGRPACRSGLLALLDAVAAASHGAGAAAPAATGGAEERATGGCRARSRGAIAIGLKGEGRERPRGGAAGA